MPYFGFEVFRLNAHLCLIKNTDEQMLVLQEKARWRARWNRRIVRREERQPAAPILKSSLIPEPAENDSVRLQSMRGWADEQDAEGESELDSTTTRSSRDRGSTRFYCTPTLTLRVCAWTTIPVVSIILARYLCLTIITRRWSLSLIRYTRVHMDTFVQ